MHLKSLPEEARPRERLLSRGAEVLSDVELLAVFLRTGTQGENVLIQAQRLLMTFGSLKQLLEADLQQFCSQPGMGKAKYALLKAVLELGKRCFLAEARPLNHLFSSGETIRYFRALFYGKKREIFIVVFLDSQRAILRNEELFAGGLEQAEIHIGEVVKAVLRHNAAAILLAHNHLSSDPRPSQADREVTQRIIHACQLIDVAVLDHLIVSRRACYSFQSDQVISC